ncbi:hypothetical protein FGB62_161g02 [Gracilaria domingensis]|nr:hypothetical protein FGB62_161g02 [Gracilaria domingensis]
MLNAAQTVAHLQRVSDGIQQSYKMGEWKQAQDILNVNITSVRQTENMIHLCMMEFQKSIESLMLLPGRRRQNSDVASESEIPAMRGVAGKFGHLETACSSLACFIGSYIQQCIPNLTVAGWKQLNGVIREGSRRSNRIRYLQPSTSERKSAYIPAFSDAGFPHFQMKTVGQEGCVVSIAFGTKKGSIFHTISWLSRKKRRVYTSVSSAETIAATTAANVAINLRDIYK